jgi:hypothetical protein
MSLPGTTKLGVQRMRNRDTLFSMSSGKRILKPSVTGVPLQSPVGPANETKNFAPQDAAVASCVELVRSSFMRWKFVIVFPSASASSQNSAPDGPGVYFQYFVFFCFCFRFLML